MLLLLRSRSMRLSVETAIFGTEVRLREASRILRRSAGSSSSSSKALLALMLRADPVFLMVG